MSTITVRRRMVGFLQYKYSTVQYISINLDSSCRLSEPASSPNERTRMNSLKKTLYTRPVTRPLLLAMQTLDLSSQHHKVQLSVNEI